MRTFILVCLISQDEHYWAEQRGAKKWCNTAPFTTTLSALHVEEQAVIPGKDKHQRHGRATIPHHVDREADVRSPIEGGRDQAGLKFDNPNSSYSVRIL